MLISKNFDGNFLFQNFNLSRTYFVKDYINQSINKKTANFPFLQLFSAQRAMHGYFSQNFDFNLRWDHQKIFYERRQNESEDDKSLRYLKLCPEKWTKK